MTRLAEHAIEVLDGLLLGRAHLLEPSAGHVLSWPLRLVLVTRTSFAVWVRQVADVLSRAGLEVRVTSRGQRLELVATGAGLARERERWLVRVPRDVRLTPTALAHWFASAGARGSNGYSVRLHTRAGLDDVAFLADRLRELYVWEPEVCWDRRVPMIRLSRGGDRLGLRRLIVGLLPSCFAGRLALRESAPCTPEEATRRRRPRKLTRELVDEIRRRVAAGESYADIANDVGVGERHVGRIARGERWADPGVSIIRRRARARRLTLAEKRRIFELADKGLSQHAIARELGVNQPRICRLLKGPRPPAV